MHEVGVVQVPPFHRWEEEELGDGVEADEDVEEGAEEEIFEADASPDVEADHASEGDVDEDDHGGEKHEHWLNSNYPGTWRIRGSWIDEMPAKSF